LVQGHDVFVQVRTPAPETPLQRHGDGAEILLQVCYRMARRRKASFRRWLPDASCMFGRAGCSAYDLTMSGSSRLTIWPEPLQIAARRSSCMLMSGNPARRRAASQLRKIER